MRVIIGVLLLGVLAICLPAAAQVFTLTPAQPSIGETVTLAYNAAAAGATLKGKASLKGEALLMIESGEPVLVPVAMVRSGQKWTGTLSLTDNRARLILFRVVAGRDQDNGDGNAPFVLVAGADGKPLRGANLQLGSLLAGGGFMEFKRTRDLAAARAAYAAEKQLYPDNWRVYPAEWNVLTRQNRGDDGRATVKAALEEYYERFKGNQEAVAVALSWFEKTGQKERGEEIRKAAIDASPTGPVAESTRRNAIFAEREPGRRAELIEAFVADFAPQGSAREDMIDLQLNSLVRAKQTDKALGLLETAPNANMYNTIAWDWIEKGENLDLAVRVAKRGVDAALNTPAGARPSYMSDEEWKDQQNRSTAMIYDTYGLGLYKLGKFAEAESALEQAHALDGGETPEITERLLMAYNKTGRNDRALEVGRKAVEQGKSTEKLIEYYKTSYIAVKGSDRGFDAIVASARAIGAKETKTKALKSRMSKPAVPFSLRDLTGNTVSLASLKGKVVVVDFWATWCGPCRESFPTLQRVYDKYRKNPAVRILALNTWERVTGKEREDLVKKFMADNKYTFPVLYDEGFVEKYGVEGIPTKFVIDRKGKLAFKSVGFNGAEEMMQELTTQIDILLAEKP